MTQALPPSGDTEQSVAAALASLTAAPEVLLVLVDQQGRILDVRKAPPAFLAAHLAGGMDHNEGDATCPSNAGRCPWRSD